MTVFCCLSGRLFDSIDNFVASKMLYKFRQIESTTIDNGNEKWNLFSFDRNWMMVHRSRFEFEYVFKTMLNTRTNGEPNAFNISRSACTHLYKKNVLSSQQEWEINKLTQHCWTLYIGDWRLEYIAFSMNILIVHCATMSAGLRLCFAGFRHICFMAFYSIPTSDWWRKTG